jgi:hypothetical protein
MATFAAAKSPSVLTYETEVIEFFSTLRDSVSLSSLDEMNIEPIEGFFDSESSILIRAVVEAIPFAPDAVAEWDSVLGPVQEAISDDSLLIAPAYAFCMAVLFVTLRECTGFKKGSNPTWLKVNGDNATIVIPELYRALSRNAENMLADLKATYADAPTQTPSFAVCSDVKQLPFKDGALFRLITSPPYLTRIDYAISTAPELSLIGGADLLRFVRHRSMGATVITKERKEQRESWGRLSNQVLDAILGHETKAAVSYYWKNIVQYFMDADAALAEIFRVMGPGGKGLVVVQSSYFKEVEIPLGEIYVEMAEARGFRASIAFREEVRGHMAHVNTKSSGYKKEKIYFEDAVLIEKI